MANKFGPEMLGSEECFLKKKTHKKRKQANSLRQSDEMQILKLIFRNPREKRIIENFVSSSVWTNSK